MLQHLIVIVIFAACLYWVVRRLVRLVSRAKRGNAHCATCTDTSCPLHQHKSEQCKADALHHSDKSLSPRPLLQRGSFRPREK